MGGCLKTPGSADLDLNFTILYDPSAVSDLGSPLVTALHERIMVIVTVDHDRDIIVRTAASKPEEEPVLLKKTHPTDIETIVY